MYYKNPSRRVYGNYRRSSDISPPVSPSSPSTTTTSVTSDSLKTTSPSDMKSPSMPATIGSLEELNGGHSYENSTYASVNTNVKIKSRIEKAASLQQNNSQPIHRSAKPHQESELMSQTANHRHDSVPSGLTSPIKHGVNVTSKLSDHTNSNGSSFVTMKTNERRGSDERLPVHAFVASLEAKETKRRISETRPRSPVYKPGEPRSNRPRRGSNENMLDISDHSSGRSSPSSSMMHYNTDSPINRLRDSPINRSHESLSNTRSSNASPVTDAVLHKQFDSSDSSKSDRGIVNVLPDRTVHTDNMPVNVQSQANSVNTNHSDNNTNSDQHTVEVTSHHKRQKSQEEIEYDQHAAILANQLKDQDRALSDVINPPPELRMTTDYMGGLFETNVNPNRKTHLVVHKTPTRTTPNKEDQQKESPLPATSPYWSPTGLANLQNKIRMEGASPDQILKDFPSADGGSLDQQKEELINRLKKKLETLKIEKQMLEEEIEANNELGNQLDVIVEKKCEKKSKKKKVPTATLR